MGASVEEVVLAASYHDKRTGKARGGRWGLARYEVKRGR